MWSDLVQHEPRQQVARYPAGRHHYCRPFDSSGLRLALHNEHIHLGAPETSIGKSTCANTAAGMSCDSCACWSRRLYDRGLSNSVQLMWRRQDSCLMPDHYGVRPEGHRRIEPLWNLLSLVCLCNTWQAWDCWGCSSQPSVWALAPTNWELKD